MVCVLLLILFFYIKWVLPAVPPPPPDEGIEVNLGNSDQGLGVDQPLLRGEPSPAEHKAAAPQPVDTHDDNMKDVETDDKAEDAPVVKKPPVIHPKATKIPEKDVVKKTVTHPKAVENPAPPVPHPKALFKGVKGTGTGGNDADTYKRGGNEGVAGGSGDQGKPGGNPNSKNYNGNGGTGHSGVSIARGLQGRRMTALPSFEDDFNENAKVAMDITVDESGKVVSAMYQPRGSTTSDASMKEIARRKAMQIKFNASGQESVGTIIFNFKLKN